MRATFVVDKEGRLQHVEVGNSAISPSAAFQACSMLKKK
jgi:alkyl hydroperoxide reductase subunit AhpC